MSKLVLKVEGLSKQYRLGEIGTGTLSHDLQRWWYKFRGKQDPFSKVGDMNRRDIKGNSDYVWALKDINFEVEKGAILGIIGRNGAGKSTLLKILSKVTGPTAGRIRSKGRIAALLEVGTGFHDELTGRENIYLNGTILGMTRKEVSRKLEEIIDFAGIERYIDTPVKRYSSGMTVRLAFSVAAHLEPEILIVDEVLAVGDASFQKKCIGKMGEISKGEGRTILFVSHTMSSIENLCDRCILLENGQIRKEGGVNEIVSMYRNLNFQDSALELKQRKDRRGNGKFRFENIVFNDNQPVIANQPLKICLHYTAKQDFNNIQLAVTVCSNIDERIMTIANIFQNIELFVPKGDGKIELELPAIQLLPNIYSLNLWCSSAKNDLLDAMVNACSLDIKDANIFNSGRKLNLKKHGLFIPQKGKWKVL